MRRNTWTLIVSVSLTVLATLVLFIVPVPYVTWSPGLTYDLLGQTRGVDTLTITGAATYPSTGELRISTVSVTRVDERLTLLEALMAYWAQDRDVLPREAVYPPGSSVQELRAREAQQMDTSQGNAVAAALRAAGMPVRELPMVITVTVLGPAYGKLFPGDLITAVAGVPVTTVREVGAAIQEQRIGASIPFSIVRDRVPMTVVVDSLASPTRPIVPIVGMTWDTGYLYEPQVLLSIDSTVGGPSAGLMVALGVYERLTPGDLLAGHRVAGSGTVTADGVVGPVGGILEKLAAAQRVGVQYFLVPAENCRDIGVMPEGMISIRVAQLSDAISALEHLSDPVAAKNVQGC